VDDYFGSGAPSPLDPQWTPAPQLHASDALDLAKPSFAFEPDSPPVSVAVATPAPVSPPVEAPAALVMAPLAAPPVAAPPTPTPVVAAAPVLAAPLAPAAPVMAPLAVPAPAPTVAAASLLAPPSAAPVSPAASAQDASSEPEAVRIGAEDTSDDSGFLTDLLVETLDRGCSDLHLTVGARPTVRQHGALTPMEDRDVMAPQYLQKVLYAILSQKQREKFEE
jgi:twitching motility protein PilT